MMQRSKSNLTPSVGRKSLSAAAGVNPSGLRSGSPSTPRRDLGTPPPHPSTPPLGNRRVASPLARSHSPYSSGGADKKSLIPKLSQTSTSSSSLGVKRGAT